MAPPSKVTIDKVDTNLVPGPLPVFQSYTQKKNRQLFFFSACENDKLGMAWGEVFFIVSYLGSLASWWERVADLPEHMGHVYSTSSA